MRHKLFLLTALIATTGNLYAQDIEPEFPGGIMALYNFIDSNLRYPTEALDYHIEGKIYITFTIEKNGYAHDAKILRGLPGGCGQAALDLVKRMPLWSPGRVHYNDGRTDTVRVQFNLPVKFTLDPQSPRRSWDLSCDTADIHFPGGTDALYRYLSNHINYPRKYWKSNVSTSVIFDSTGNITEVFIHTHLPEEHQGLADAIRTALMSMPHWIPGKLSRNHASSVPIDLPLLASMHDTLLRPSFFSSTDYEWKYIIANEDYFRQVLALNDSLCAGYTVPDERLLALAPRDESHFHTLCHLDYYVRSGDGMAILNAMADCTVNDRLDMMEHFIHWLNWCDGYVSELLYDYAIDIERRHPDKFRRLMMQICPDHWEDFVEWRNAYLEWEKENK